MRRIELPPMGSHPSAEIPGWSELALEPWASRLVDCVAPGSRPTEVQRRAIDEAAILTSRRNLIVASSTNSGKSLIGYLALFRGVKPGARVLLLEPLRVLAQEKFEELKRISSALAGDVGREIGISITTGDYRMDEETMQSPPSEEGEIIVATPERIEAIMRNPDNDDWIQSIAVSVVDEAHLLGDRVRGASLEYVITSLKMLKVPPRVLLLSATLGETDSLQDWLEPCDVINAPNRTPRLNREILVEESEGESFSIVTEHARSVLEDPTASLLIFVYLTASADKLARELKKELGPLAGDVGVVSFHARQSVTTRENVRASLIAGKCRCVVATTALGMGVNLPSTHVLLKDLSRSKGAKVSINELVQMSGRAGRGSREGSASFLVKTKDVWKVSELQELLCDQKLEGIVSSFLTGDAGGNYSGEGSPPVMAESVLSLLVRRREEGMEIEDVERFACETLAGEPARTGVGASLSWLSQPSRILVYQDDSHWFPTALGERVCRSSMPLDAATGLAQLVRDLLSVDEGDGIIKDFGMLDLLLLGELLGSGVSARLSYSEKLATQVDSWAETSDEKSVLFRKWIRGKEGFSQADELFGSMGVGIGMDAKSCRKNAYVAMARTIILWQRAQGVSAADVSRRWGYKELPEIEERWRDNRLFLVGTMISIWEIRCFFYHLKEECSAGGERILRVKRGFQRVRGINARLLNLLSWCSPLGPVFVRLRARGGKGMKPGVTTMRKLEAAGVDSLAALKVMDDDQLKRLGISKPLRSQLRTFALR